MKWNPRYVAYAAAHGLTPGQMQKSKMGGFPSFSTWVHRQWSACAAQITHGKALSCEELEKRIGISEAHRQFDKWLAERFPAVKSESGYPDLAVDLR